MPKQYKILTSRGIHLSFRKGILAGNRKLKIYGTLDCYSGKRMKKKNRVFFLTELDALQCSYRPCKICMYK